MSTLLEYKTGNTQSKVSTISTPYYIPGITVVVVPRLTYLKSTVSSKSIEGIEGIMLVGTLSTKSADLKILRVR